MASEYFKTSQIAFGVVDGVLKITPSDIKRLRAKISDRRIIVVVDDLDRTDPSLVPKLLLSLRELLDLPGFSFLLPFDHEVVASALLSYNKAWKNGDKFLEKILDFRVVVPEATPDQRFAVFEEELASHCSFITRDAVADLGEVLPSNPRKVKSIVRSLVALKRDALRHRPGEIDWRSIVFASMIRSESPAFFQAYVDDLFREDGKNPWLAAFVAKDRNEQLEQSLQAIFARTKVEDPHLRKRLSDLCLSWRAHGALKFGGAKYAVYLLDRSEAVTKGEYDTAIDNWLSDRDAAPLVNWASDRSKHSNVSVATVLKGLVDAVVRDYDLYLAAASEAFLEEDNATINGRGAELLALLEALSGTTATTHDLRLHMFDALLAVAFRWAAFNRNRSDEVLREAERTLLTALLRGARSNWLPFGKVMQTRFSSGLRDRGRQGLIEVLRQALLQPIRNDAVTLLSKVDGVQSLVSHEVDDDLRCEVLDTTSPLWQPQGGSPAEAILATAASQKAVQRNAYSLLALLQTVPSFGSTRAEALARGFISNSHYLSAVWNAAIARPLQYRNLQDTRELRQFLVGAGASEDVLPMPAWLEVT